MLKTTRHNRIRRDRRRLNVQLTCSGMAAIPELGFKDEQDVSIAHRTYGLRSLPRERNARLLFGTNDVFAARLLRLLRRVGCDTLLCRDCADLAYQFRKRGRRWLCISHDGARLAHKVSETDGLAVDLEKLYGEVIELLTRIANTMEQSKPEAVAAN